MSLHQVASAFPPRGRSCRSSARDDAHPGESRSAARARDGSANVPLDARGDDRAARRVVRLERRHRRGRPSRSHEQRTEVTAMKAVVQDKYGEAEDVLRLADIERPHIAANEVLLRVHAAGLDRGVWHFMTGLPYPIRLAGFGVRAPKNPVIGMDLAGRVQAVGAEVTDVQVGDA